MGIYTETDFAGRVNYAAKVISERRATTRGFDTCFEMNDGDAVIAALCRRAETNKRLAENMPQYLSARSLAEIPPKYAGQNLSVVACHLRARAREAFDRLLEARQHTQAA
jgi:hypothetical protein